MDRKIGFIGCGVMGKAIINGIIGAGTVSVDNIIASDVSDRCLNDAKERLGICVTRDNREIVLKSDIIFLAVKPAKLSTVIQGIVDCITPDKLFVSIVAGQTLEILERYLGKNVKTIRVMPNMPAQITVGMTGVCGNKLVSKEEFAYILELLKGLGRVETVPEDLMNAVTGVSGSGPAYTFMFIEALADAGVLEGLPRAQAYTFAAQTVYGSAKMILDTQSHPGVLKDAICSPGGTTIAAVAVLEKSNFRGAVIEAVRACANRSREMEKQAQVSGGKVDFM